jgi:hypothetical protein
MIFWTVIPRDSMNCRLFQIRMAVKRTGTTTIFWQRRPTNASIVAVRSLIELKAEEAIPLFVDLLFETWRFPRLTVAVEAQYFFAPLGKIAIEPLCEAFELSGPEEDEGRRDVVATLGLIGTKHPALQAEIANRIATWLMRHDLQNMYSNSEIVCVLLYFKANHMADTIRSAMDAECIDTSVCGDWDEIRSELG